MKKILFLIPTLANGGAEKVLVNLANNLDKTKYDITVMTISDVGIYKEKLESNIHYKSIFKRIRRGATYILKLFSADFLHKLYIGDNYDIEIGYLEGAATRLINAAPSNVKKISWIHSGFTSDKELTRGFRNIKEARKSYSNSNIIVSVSEDVKEAFKRISGVSSDYKVLYNTNNTAEIVNKSEETIVDNMFDFEGFKICTVGKITESKNVICMARILRRLTEEGIYARAYVIGEGNEKKNIETYINDNCLNDRFFFLGYKSNPYKYVKNCDLYLCSSLKEGFSTAVTESLIVGTPVVTTPCSGMREMLGENNEYGIVTKDYEEESLYEAVKDLAENKGKWLEYKKRAKERGLKFSCEATAKAVEDMLDNI